MHRSSPFLLLPLLVACRAGVVDKGGSLEDSGGAIADDTAAPADSGGTGTGATDSGGTDSGGTDSGSTDSGSTDSGGTDSAWCIGFEGGTLEPVGYSGTLVERGDGGLVVLVEEGDDWSALLGEEALALRGDHALVLRSSHKGDPKSEGIATTAPFEVTHDHLSLWQLSEVDDRGVAMTAELLDEAGETVLASVALPVVTGGFVPQLKPEHEPIPGFPEITWDSGTPGTLTRVVTDLSAWRGATVRLRLRQHTRVEDNGFFTLFDDICLGEGEGAADLVWPSALTVRGRSR